MLTNAALMAGQSGEMTVEKLIFIVAVLVIGWWATGFITRDARF